ncbi:3-oxoacyl-[acyl-carrier-protein] synthase I [biofilm metagenome]
MKLYLNDLGLLCAASNSRQEIMAKILSGDRSGLIECDDFGINTVVGKCHAELPVIDETFSHYECRNNRLLLSALAQIRQSVDHFINKYGNDRIGVVLGTSTSGVRSTELALAYKAAHGILPDNFHYKQQQMGAGADFLAAYLGITGPAYLISTACSASGKAFASARRLINLDLCDAVIVGGADSLCGLTINGFAALDSLSTGLCKPFGKHRNGINIGEAACLFILSKEPGPVYLAGIGANSDAYHFSAPDPSGAGVTKAMCAALQDAGRKPQEIDYINLHGTATVLNDAMESKAVNELFGCHVAASSSKGMTGHTLGVAAALELGLCWLSLIENNDNYLIPNINDDEPDSNLPAVHLTKTGERSTQTLQHCQSNSFAFGGSNVSLIISKS